MALDRWLFNEAMVKFVMNIRGCPSAKEFEFSFPYEVVEILKKRKPNWLKFSDDETFRIVYDKSMREGL